MKAMVMGLCRSRHDMPVDDYIFENTVDPLDLNQMQKVVHNKLQFCCSLELYVTGLTVALVTVINYCCHNLIPLTLYHFDAVGKRYYPQQVATTTWKDCLQEAGYLK